MCVVSRFPPALVEEGIPRGQEGSDFPEDVEMRLRNAELSRQRDQCGEADSQV